MFNSKVFRRQHSITSRCQQDHFIQFQITHLVTGINFYAIGDRALHIDPIAHGSGSTIYSIPLTDQSGSLIQTRCSLKAYTTGLYSVYLIKALVVCVMGGGGGGGGGGGIGQKNRGD